MSNATRKFIFIRIMARTGNFYIKLR